MKPLRDVRVIPVVVVAICGLAVLKIAGLVLDGGYVFDYNPQSTKPSWAQDMLNFPGGPRKADPAGTRPSNLDGDSSCANLLFRCILPAPI